jgi:hypothetical protein
MVRLSKNDAQKFARPPRPWSRLTVRCAAAITDQPIGGSPCRTTNSRAPKEIIEFCLNPLGLDKKSPAYEAAFARLEHVIKTYQKEILREKKPISVDFSQMRTITHQRRRPRPRLRFAPPAQTSISATRTAIS